MKLIKTKNIASGSVRLLHSNTPVNNFQFLAYKLLTSSENFGKWGKCPGQAIFES